MVGLLLGVAATPEPAEAERRATRAATAFMQLHPDPDQAISHCLRQRDDLNQVRTRK